MIKKKTLVKPAIASHQKMVRMTTTALFSALICVTTAFICHIPFGLSGGYVHVGDALIYLASAILPTPYALAAGALGGVFADILTAPVWAPATLVIKALLTIPFTCKKDKIINVQNIIAVFLASGISIAGYYFAEYLLFGTWAGATASIVSSILQAIASAILFFIFGYGLDKMNFKRMAHYKFKL